MSDAAVTALHPVRPESEVGVAADGGDEHGDEAEQEEAGGEMAEGELHPAEEARQVKKARDPGAPTRAEWEAHQATHLLFRIWCDECVKGRCDNPPHLRIRREPGAVPEVGFDYAFVRKDGEPETVTILVMKDRDSRAQRAWVAQCKGTDLESTVSNAVEGVRDLGHRGTVAIKADNEPAMKGFREAVMKQLTDGTIPIRPPPGESESNGVVEVGVKYFMGLLRVHLGALERKLRVSLPSQHPVFSWLVEHVADVMTKYLVGVDGHTAYERLYGKAVREEGLEFGEQVLF